MYCSDVRIALHATIDTMKTYTGGCHCKAVRYQVNMNEISDAMACNCSHCGAKGFLLAFAPIHDFTLLSGEDSLTSYKFNKKVIDHLFCKICGVESFARGPGPQGEAAMINVRCLDDVDTNALSVTNFNGKDLM